MGYRTNEPDPTRYLRRRGTDALLAAIKADPNVSPAFKKALPHPTLAELLADEIRLAKARALPILTRAAERACPKCGAEMEDQDPIKAEPDVGIPAFAGGFICPECWALVPNEPDEVDQERDHREGPLGGGFIAMLILIGAGMLIPSAPPPNDLSLPSTGDKAVAPGPAPVTADVWRGFLYEV